MVLDKNLPPCSASDEPSPTGIHQFAEKHGFTQRRRVGFTKDLRQQLSDLKLSSSSILTLVLVREPVELKARCECGSTRRTARPHLCAKMYSRS